ncbi:MAG: DinB family protein [Fimbriimonadaceae bacterium]|nr:DinB family protein [Fimbriimonadaceae bacterium]QYK55714.1 MAG: DinB family protein [Fimbriimonadaceae bacterium]
MRDYRFQALGAAPKIVERLLRAYPRDRFDERPHDESLTSREIVALLADSEQIVLDRIRMAKSHPGSTVEWYEPATRAKDKHYSDKNPFHEAEIFESRRQMTIDYLRDCSEGDLTNHITLDGHGTYTIDQYLTMVLAHDMERIAEISEFLANEAASIA